MRWICISSIDLSFRYCWTMFAPPPDADVLVVGGGTGQFECGLDPIRHERVGRPALFMGSGSLALRASRERRNPERRGWPDGSNPDIQHPLPDQDRPADA